MLVLHASFDDGRLLLWGESPRSENDHSAPGVFPNGRLSPFDAGASALQSALGRCEELSTLALDEALTVCAWLPTRRRLPLPSSGLIAESAAEAGKKPGLGDWDVTALGLPCAAVVRLLTRTKSNHMLEPGVVIGEDLQFWWYAFAFASGLVSHQSYLPGIRRTNESWIAVWEPVIAGDDLERFLQLVAAAPDSCRAVSLVESGNDQPPSLMQVVYRFVGTMVDHLVRRAAQGLATASRPVTAADAWLSALRGLDPTITADDTKISELQSSLLKWKRPIISAANAPFRLCFRLEEPQEAEHSDVVGDDMLVKRQSWRITYLLQSTTDHSLLIDATSVWHNDSGSKVLARAAFSAREYLLASLGAASMLYPPVERSLLSPAPASVEIDVDEAYRFLTHHAELLRQSGFAVMLPAWWTAKGRKRLTARANVQPPTSMKSKAKLSLDTMVEFKWQVALGERLLSKTELEELARLKIPLVQVRGQWMELQPEQLQAALDFLKNKKQTLALRQLLQLNLGGLDLPSVLPFTGITGSGWVSDLLMQLEGESGFAEIEAPAQFQGTLRPYQQRGYSWLDFLSKWGLGACLADDMGLGKTVQTLALLEKQWQDTTAAARRPVLLVCPMSVVGNWQKEARRFTPDLPVLVHHGVARTRDELFSQAAHKQALVITSYSLLHRDSQFLGDVDWAGVILDEAQNIKNAETRQAKAARSLRGGYKIALTGTPVENNIGDLWSLMEFLNPGLLGTARQFKQRFLTPIQVDSDQEAAGRLKRLTQPFILRRLKTDKTIIADLPDKIEMKDFCNLTREQASLYRAVLRDLELKLVTAQGSERSGLVLATLSKLKQVCNHPAQFLHDNSEIAGRSGKLLRLTEMLEEALQVGDRILIFTQFAEMGEIIQEHVQNQFGQEVLYLHGAVSKQKRDRLVERFQQEEGGPQVFILSLKAGGTGLNLTRANQVIHFDRWWNPAVENQATDRAFRIGQTRQVNVHKFVVIGTLEEKIDEIIQEKQQVAETIIGSGESWLTQLSNDQIRDIFALQEEAVSE